MRTIVVGYDGTRPAEEALRRATELAQPLGASVVVVDVAAPEVPIPATGAFGLMPYTLPPESDVLPEEELWDRHRAHAKAVLEEHGVPHEFTGVIGRPAEEIIDAAERRQADLIVVGTRDLGFLDRLLGGSVSEDVARGAPCDVLIVRPPRGTD